MTTLVTVYWVGQGKTVKLILMSVVGTLAKMEAVL